MKEIRFRLILIIGVIALCLYLLYPTLKDYLNNQEADKQVEKLLSKVKQNSPSLSDEQIREFKTSKKDSIFANKPEYKSAREKRIKLGLDLQGGMYLLMEVNTAKLLERLAKDPDDIFKQILKESELESKLTDENVVSILSKKMKQRSIRLSRYFGSIREDDSQIQSKLLQQEADAVTRAIEIMRNRVDQYGVSEPSIQKQGSRRIVIQLPGVAREEEAKKLLQAGALLEFKFLKEPDVAIPILKKIDEALAGANKIDSLNQKKIETAKADTSQKNSSQRNILSLL